MRKGMLILLLVIFNFLFHIQDSFAQCSICTKTTQQLGEKPAKGLNAGIIYLGLTPFLLAGYVFYRWRKSNHQPD